MSPESNGVASSPKKETTDVAVSEKKAPEEGTSAPSSRLPSSDSKEPTGVATSQKKASAESESATTSDKKGKLESTLESIAEPTTKPTDAANAGKVDLLAPDQAAAVFRQRLRASTTLPLDDLPTRLPVAPRDIDFDEKAREIFKRLNLGPDGEAQEEDPYRNMDCIYKHAVSGAGVFVGNRSAAQNLDTLKSNGISCIVNCQDDCTPNFFENEPGISYKRFTVEWWWTQQGNDTPEGISQFFREPLLWIDKHVSEGRGVLIHCLAGAHRAGAVGVAYLMHATGAKVKEATLVAQKRRPIIELCGSLEDLLLHFDKVGGKVADAPAIDKAPAQEKHRPPKQSAQEKHDHTPKVGAAVDKVPRQKKYQPPEQHDQDRHDHSTKVEAAVEAPRQDHSTKVGAAVDEAPRHKKHKPHEQHGQDNHGHPTQVLTQQQSKQQKDDRLPAGKHKLSSSLNHVLSTVLKEKKGHQPKDPKDRPRKVVLGTTKPLESSISAHGTSFLSNDGQSRSAGFSSSTKVIERPRRVCLNSGPGHQTQSVTTRVEEHNISKTPEQPQPAETLKRKLTAHSQSLEKSESGSPSKRRAHAVSKSPSSSSGLGTPPESPSKVSGEVTENDFQPGENVEYFSITKNDWVRATIVCFRKEVRLYNLNIKSGVEVRHIRRVSTTPQGASKTSPAKAGKPETKASRTETKVVVSQTTEPRSEYALGEQVEYYSESGARWVRAEVLRCDVASKKYDLNVKAGVSSSKIRPCNVASRRVK
eukprot:gnl/MRDRNA2_/MRDRNA2_32918_c0_seq1.p1 gnl/MRDRNA2_/MRDRNA2_32918_c0~~gnl/MRDRNA2_/MRDRNA2_32918_c0_seq1.p1  ORF type:complete len:824 (-),score=167.95 gnl/MRDRNA2_/MRDRNA2_32918_c0_seq1:41-2311(-)